MSNIEKAAKCLRAWPRAYLMATHDRNVCKIAADALDEVEQLRKDNKLLVACVKTAIKYKNKKDPVAALNYLVRKLREAVSD